MPWPSSLRRRRINVYFVYAPPLDEYSGPEFSEPSSAPEAARWWAAHVLPVDPHDAERVLDLVGKDQIRLKPAVPPSVVTRAGPESAVRRASALSPRARP